MVTEIITPQRFVTPEALVSHFHIREGESVADFGAGKGNFALLLAKVVGVSGKVYACEIQKNLVETIANTVRVSGVNNVEAIWCDIEAHQGTKLESDSLDVAILVNTLFQMEQKGEAIDEIKRTLRSGGRLFIVDWSDSFGGLGPQGDQVITEVSARDLVEEHGLPFERSYDAGDHHYGLAFRKP